MRVPSALVGERCEGQRFANVGGHGADSRIGCPLVKQWVTSLNRLDRASITEADLAPNVRRIIRNTAHPIGHLAAEFFHIFRTTFRDGNFFMALRMLLAG